ncbi:MAG: RNA polymerase subunit sigma-70 [Flavobacteriaceae bacterium]|nr:RNA polymerase subunit sigma-70 [Flavobacteriaceae bacterium]
MSHSLLVEQCRQHNRKAQMALYKQYCDGMFKVASRYLRDTAEAEDALQEAFIKAFKKLDQFKGDVTFGAWLKRIVINTCLDCIKAKKAIVEPLDDELLHVPDEDSDWSVPDETTMDEVLAAIGQLPHNFRCVVQLYLLEGYDHREIASILDISESASRTNLYRGKLQLQNTLKHLQYGTGY